MLGRPDYEISGIERGASRYDQGPLYGRGEVPGLGASESGRKIPIVRRVRHETAAVDAFPVHFEDVAAKRLGRMLPAQSSARRNQRCRLTRILGIDEHFASRRRHHATTFCDLAKYKAYDVVFGRTEAALARYLHHVKGKEKVRVVCIDLSSTYRALVTKHFRNALTVTDRFHVIRLIAQQFLTAWRHIDP